MDSFIMYQSFYDAINTLDPESQLALYQAISRYSFYEEEPELTGAALGMWMLIKPLLDSNAEKRAKKQESGKAGGKQTASKREANEKQTDSKREAEAKQTDSKSEANGKLMNNVNVNVNGNVNGNVKGDSKGGRFTPPTVDEVRSYCAERKNGVDPQHFVDFYASKGWKVGNQPMKDWKACVRTWETRNRSAPPKNPMMTRSGSDLDDLERMILQGGL